MDDKADKPKRRWPTYLAIGIVLVVVYPLSVGPAIVVAHRINNRTAYAVFRTIYSPLEPLGKIQAIQRGFGQYNNW